MATTDPKHIQFNRADKDYSAYYDGEYIGTFSTYHQAEIELDARTLDLLERGLIDTAEGITTMQWQAPRDVVLARPAEVVEVLHSAEPDEDTPELAINDHVRIIDVTRTPDRDSEMLNGTTGVIIAVHHKQYSEMLNGTTGVIIAVHHKQYEVMFDGNAFGPYYDRDWFFESELELIQALPAASPAAAINARASDSSDGLGTPTGGREDAAPGRCSRCGAVAGSPQTADGYYFCDDCNAKGTQIIAFLGVCPDCGDPSEGRCQACREDAAPADPRATLMALLKAALEEWKECGVATPYDVALAQLARLMTPPAGHFLCCPLCGGPHPSTRCPEVALVKYGMDVWEAYLEDRAAFLRLAQWATAARLLLMGDAVALYLSHRWRHAITAQQVLAGWQTQNAAPTS